MSRSGGGLGGCHGSRAGGRVVLRTSPGRPLIHLHLICSHFHAAPGPRAATSPLVSIALNRGRWRLICIHPLSFASHFRGTRGWGDWEEAGGHGVTSRPGAGCRDVTREAGCGDVMRLPRFPPPSQLGGRGAVVSPDVGAGGTTALLRCFPCERLCGVCLVPPAAPGVLPPAMAPPRRRLPPRTFRSYLPRSHRTYSCVHCRAHLAQHEELISKSFQGSHGRAYLFNSVVNVGCGPAEQRLLLTGLHSVADIFCQSCKTTLGWKYVSAPLHCAAVPRPHCGHPQNPSPATGTPWGTPIHEGHPQHPKPLLWAPQTHSMGSPWDTPRSPSGHPPTPQIPG
ncbi:protein yippee-like 4 isoform X1 [Cuculus canorus]|uniref:protein yippee-like 4 isoform X1 n=1 Tax=Cuculus canorus TaxID=55661 RepID=UPI0023AADB45|nr:protein yippee-like 4 isoform X1 [Cuculus canorus]